MDCKTELAWSDYASHTFVAYRLAVSRRAHPLDAQLDRIHSAYQRRFKCVAPCCYLGPIRINGFLAIAADTVYIPLTQ